MALINFIRDEEGVTAIEYGLLAALIAAVIIASVGLLGNNLNSQFEDLANTIAPVTGGGS